ncbi:MAG: hypothetical protein EKK54_06145 [Neisseriaceae bacterium]|nr:MAG: hypothetical protein EKK54_06145 [Neisseriaceae bacterium]
MKFINRLKIFILITFPNFVFASSITAGFPGVQKFVQMAIDTMCGPWAFLASCAGLVAGAAIWKFGGHMAGMKFLSGVLIGMIVLLNVVAWVSLITGAVI